VLNIECQDLGISLVFLVVYNGVDSYLLNTIYYDFLHEASFKHVSVFLFSIKVRNDLMKKKIIFITFYMMQRWK
jgi:hypothetical protein